MGPTITTPRLALELDDPEQEEQRERDDAGDQQRAETSQPVREKEEHARPRREAAG